MVGNQIVLEVQLKFVPFLFDIALNSVTNLTAKKPTSLSKNQKVFMESSNCTNNLVVSSNVVCKFGYKHTTSFSRNAVVVVLIFFFFGYFFSSFGIDIIFSIFTNVR